MPYLFVIHLCSLNLIFRCAAPSLTWPDNFPHIFCPALRIQHPAYAIAAAGKACTLYIVPCTINNYLLIFNVYGFISFKSSPKYHMITGSEELPAMVRKYFPGSLNVNDFAIISATPQKPDGEVFSKL
jgi:hypothetical protein